MRALNNLPSPNSTLTSLQQFHDAIESHTRSLTALGKDSDTYGDLLVSMMKEKLPPDIQRNLARERYNDDWTLRELQTALLQEIRILETATTGYKQKHPTASFHTDTRTTSSGNNKKYPCVYCSGPHPPSYCTVITDPKKRMKIVKQQRLCFNCLAHHRSSQCQSKNRCCNCRHKHHTSLCTGTNSEPSTAKQSTNSPTVVSSSTSESATGTTAIQNNTAVTTISSTSQQLTLYSSHSNLCLLKTATATVSTSNHHAKAKRRLTTVIYVTDPSQYSTVTTFQKGKRSTISFCITETITSFGSGADQPHHTRWHQTTFISPYCANNCCPTSTCCTSTSHPVIPSARAHSCPLSLHH